MSDQQLTAPLIDLVDVEAQLDQHIKKYGAWTDQDRQEIDALLATLEATH